jgi:nucleoside-diphosphate-sugar epimerase
MKSKVLLTGATGFVGANLVRKLIKEDYEVHILTRKNSNKKRLKEIENRVNEHIVDLTEKEKLQGALDKIKPEIIFHLATRGIYGGVQDSDEELIKTNIVGTKNLIDACESIEYKCFINTEIGRAHV